MQHLSDTFEAEVCGPDTSAALLERHRPVQAPYPGAPGFVLAHCRVCDGVRWTVRVAGEPYRCAVWGEAVAAGLVAEGVRGTSSVG